MALVCSLPVKLFGFGEFTVLYEVSPFVSTVITMLVIAVARYPIDRIRLKMSYYAFYVNPVISGVQL